MAKVKDEAVKFGSLNKDVQRVLRRLVRPIPRHWLETAITIRGEVTQHGLDVRLVVTNFIFITPGLGRIRPAALSRF